MDPEVKDLLVGWRTDPVRFVKQVFGAEPDPWQEDALGRIAGNQRVCMKACKGPGKTTVLAWAIWWFLTVHPQAQVAATSITKDNLEDCLWKELAKWRGRSTFLQAAFEWTKTRVFARDSSATWFCSARTWPKTADSTQQADTLAGLHADYMMFVLDESGGIPEAVMASADAGLATGIVTKVIQAGNPTHLEGPLYAACTKEADLWEVIEITGDPDDPKRATRISLQWAKEQIQKYGKDNPWVMVNVYGRFPPESINALLGPDDVREAMKRHLREDEYCFSQKRVGVDVARFGDDSTVIFPRQGRASFKFVELKGARTNEIAARVALAKERWGVEMVLVDATGGYGAGVEDALLQADIGSIGVSFSGKAMDARYFNKRSEMWFRMAKWIKGGGALPNDPVLLKELTAPTYGFQNGKLRLEEKEHIKARLGFSPDRADALALTFALPDAPGNEPTIPGLTMRNEGKMEYDYNPLDKA